MRKKVVIWANILSPHLTWFYKYISCEFELTVVYAENDFGERKEQGWNEQREDGYIACHFLDIDKILCPNTDYTHIYCGFHLVDFFQSKCTTIKVERFSIISEAPIVMDKKDFLMKTIKYVFYRIRFGHELDYIFCMGELGCQWFSRFFPLGVLVQFQYFVEQGTVVWNENFSDKKRFIYIGQLNKRKNVALLVEALVLSEMDNWTLDIIGSGPEYSDLFLLLNNYGVIDKVNFLENINNDKVNELLSNGYDCLVLPSKFDGWGAVCSESLSNGVPIIVSDKCGSSTLIEKFKLFGYSFNGSVCDLQCRIRDIFNRDKLSYDERLLISSKYLHVQKECAENFCLIFRD